MRVVIYNFVAKYLYKFRPLFQIFFHNSLKLLQDFVANFSFVGQFCQNNISRKNT